MADHSEGLGRDEISDDLTHSASVLDRFLVPDEKDSHWTTAVKLATDIGYQYLTMAAVSKYNGAPLWVRSTTSDAWALTYMEKDYFHRDPLIAHMMRSNEQAVFDCTSPVPPKADPKVVEFQEDARRLGYGKFRAFPFNWPTQSVFLVTTFILKADKAHLETPQMVKKARFLAEIFPTRIGAPKENIGLGVMWPPQPVLTDRERELLYYLAIGLKNDRIAERCGLAEVTVRKHLLNARQKLGAATREQALAIALQNGLVNL